MCWMSIWEITSSSLRKTKYQAKEQLKLGHSNIFGLVKQLIHQQLPLHGNINRYLLKERKDLLLKREI